MLLYGLFFLVTVTWSQKLKVEYEWSSVDFLYSSQNKKNADLSSRRLIPSNLRVLDSDVYGNTVFVTTPKFFPGTPYTLSTVSNVRGPGGYLLKPFPSEQAHDSTICGQTIVSVWRTKIDSRGRLWVIDSGIIDAFVDAPRVCPPQILVFDLNNNNRLIRRHQIKEEELSPESLLITIEVEELDSSGDNTFAYVADPQGFRLFVYNFANHSSYSIKHPYFYPSPAYGFYNINGVRFVLMDGIFSLALGPRSSSGIRRLYFHSLSSGFEGYIETRYLRDPSTAEDPYKYFQSIEQRTYHASIEVVDKQGIMIISNVDNNSLEMWDTRQDYKPRTFRTVAKDDRILDFTSGMKIVYSNTLAITTSRIQHSIVGTMPTNEINYRIISANIPELLNGT